MCVLQPEKKAYGVKSVTHDQLLDMKSEMSLFVCHQDKWRTLFAWACLLAWWLYLLHAYLHSSSLRKTRWCWPKYFLTLLKKLMTSISLWWMFFGKFINNEDFLTIWRQCCWLIDYQFHEKIIPKICVISRKNEKKKNIFNFFFENINSTFKTLSH